MGVTRQGIHTILIISCYGAKYIGKLLILTLLTHIHQRFNLLKYTQRQSSHQSRRGFLLNGTERYAVEENPSAIFYDKLLLDGE